MLLRSAGPVPQTPPAGLSSPEVSSVGTEQRLRPQPWTPREPPCPAAPLRAHGSAALGCRLLHAGPVVCSEHGTQRRGSRPVITDAVWHCGTWAQATGHYPPPCLSLTPTPPPAPGPARPLPTSCATGHLPTRSTACSQHLPCILPGWPGRGHRSFCPINPGASSQPGPGRGPPCLLSSRPLRTSCASDPDSDTSSTRPAGGLPGPSHTQVQSWAQHPPSKLFTTRNALSP